MNTHICFRGEIRKTNNIFWLKNASYLMLSDIITKTRLFKYTENFATKK